MAINWNKNFKTEYDATRVVMAKNRDFLRDWQALVQDLEQLLGVNGFDAGKENSLGKLRTKITKGVSQTKITEDKGILQAVGAWVEGTTGTIGAEDKKRAASLVTEKYGCLIYQQILPTGLVNTYLHTLVQWGQSKLF